MNINILFVTILIFGTLITLITSAPLVSKFIKTFIKDSNYSSLGPSSKIRLVHQLTEAVSILSKAKTGAIITITHKDKLDLHRTDGIIINANISASLIISLFNKYSPLHDGAIIIENTKIKFASTFYKITNKSVDNKYGARHRAALGISEITDSLTIVVSEETGGISFVKNGVISKVSSSDFQSVLSKNLKG